MMQFILVIYIRKDKEIHRSTNANGGIEVYSVTNPIA